VTRVPPTILGYRHVNDLRYIDGQGAVSDRAPMFQHFFSELFGSAETLLDILGGLEHGTMKTAPRAVLDHMPGAYAVWTWNDLDANG
jgi:hypothetical protein